MNNSNKREGHPIPGGVYTHSHRHITKDRQHVITAGEGCYVETESGERYIDYLLGQGPLICGHAHPHVTDAIQEQATRGTHYTLSARPSLKLAERIVDASPCADHLRFTCTGSQATYIALRLARAYTGKEKILKFEGSYHGYHDYAMRSSSRASLAELSRHTYPDGTVDSPGVLSGAAESVLVAPFNDLDTTSEIVTAHSDDIAAIIVEPMQRSLPPVDGFLAGLRDLADKYNITLIFDEVVTGFDSHGVVHRNGMGSFQI
jgi:glutamate-1-semialdehyde 2,1-aminomutase